VIVDAPGYGFKLQSAKVDWENLVREYLTGSKRLKLIVSLINAQHGLLDIDKEWLTMLKTVKAPVLPVLSKCDKVHNLAEVAEKCWNDTRKMKTRMPYILTCSSKTQLGMDELRAVIAETALSTDVAEMI